MFPSCTTLRGRTIRSPRGTSAGCWRWARRIASFAATRPISSSWAAPDSKLNPLSMVRQCLFGHLSQRNDAPEKACRPFDKQRDGIVIGEGSGVLVVEELEHAFRRGASIYAEVIGIGCAFQSQARGHGPGPSHARPRWSKRGSASRTSTMSTLTAWDRRKWMPPKQEPDGSSWPVRRNRYRSGPARAISAISAPAAVLIELAASLLALKHGIMPATLNCDEPDVGDPLDIDAQPCGP